MATIRFYTRSSKEKLAPLHLRFRDGRDIDIRIVTPFRIFPAYWSDARQKMKDSIPYTEEFDENKVLDFGERLAGVKSAILRERNKLTVKPSIGWLEKTVNDAYYTEPSKDETLTQYIDRFVKEAKSGQRLTSGAKNRKKYTYGTTRVLTGFKQSFDHFCDKKERRYNFADINQDFYNDWIQFFYDRNCSANYIGRRIRTLKQIMEAARSEGLHTNTDYKLRAFKSISVEVDKIYLTEAEIKQLFELDLKEKPEWDFIRDKFLIGVYTGQRFSDFNRISNEYVKTIKGKKIIELSSQKTNTKTFIPVRPELDFILNKYPTMKKITDQYLNREIKLIASEAKINDIVYVKTFPGGLEMVVKKKKWELISSHCARRSFCTNAYLSGLQIIDIMKISGHKSPDEFRKYVRIDSLNTALNLADNDFFMGNVLKVAK